ncbi:MAG: toll/interleukin-1 receptor domain-containing protein, partial [Promethearchaeota archaeon]
WIGKSKEIIDRDIPAILEYCQKIATIDVFISHAWIDQDDYQVLKLKNTLENFEEIYQVFICEKDLVGNIQKFMDETIPKCNLVLFLGTKNALKSEPCLHELAIAKSNEIPIIPIKGGDIDWNDLNHIDLTAENQGYLDLGNEKGLNFDLNNFDGFCSELYSYIKQYKRNFNLFEHKTERIKREKENIRNITIKYLESNEFKELIGKNLTELENIFQQLSSNLITPLEYIYKWIQLFSKQDD